MLKTEKDTPEFSDAQEARGKCSQEELGTQTDWTRMSRSLSGQTPRGGRGAQMDQRFPMECIFMFSKSVQ